MVVGDGGGLADARRGLWTVDGDWWVVHLEVMGRASGSIWANLKLTKPSNWPGGVPADTQTLLSSVAQQ
jgi:hypothetical protein